MGEVLLQSGIALMYSKEGQVLLQKGAFFLYYKAEPVVLKSRKWDNFYYKMGKTLRSGATFITKWGRYYKKRELIQGMEVHSCSQLVHSSTRVEWLRLIADNGSNKDINT